MLVKEVRKARKDLVPGFIVVCLLGVFLCGGMMFGLFLGTNHPAEVLPKQQADTHYMHGTTQFKDLKIEDGTVIQNIHSDGGSQRNLAMFSSSNTLQNSSITDDGTGMTVNGDVHIHGHLYVRDDEDHTAHVHH